MKSDQADMRVRLKRPSALDEPSFLAAARRSRAFLRRWAPPPYTPKAYRAYLQRLRSAYLGYYAFVPHAGRGYMSEGLALALRWAFRELHLHRVEANIQPANEASRALVRRLGFRREGFSRQYLKIGGRWRDHERWALLAEDWHGRGQGAARR